MSHRGCFEFGEWNLLDLIIALFVISFLVGGPWWGGGVC